MVILPYSAKESNRLSTVQTKRLYKHIVLSIMAITLVSGSPIIQDGKRIGAVTHVLVGAPEIGYGIFIENMLDAAG